MLVYSKVLLILGAVNLFSCSAFSIYYYVKPSHFAIGTVINSVGYIISFFSFFIMLVLAVIYSVALRKSENTLISFTPINVLLYVLFVANAVYALFLGHKSPIYDSLEPAKIVAGLALALLLNLTIVIMTVNYIKHNS